MVSVGFDFLCDHPRGGFSAPFSVLAGAVDTFHAVLAILSGSNSKLLF